MNFSNPNNLPLLGVAQTWQNVTSDRQGLVSYINDTGRPIFISVWAALSTSTTTLRRLEVSGDGTNWIDIAGAGSSEDAEITAAIIPANYYYRFKSNFRTLYLWAELR